MSVTMEREGRLLVVRVVGPWGEAESLPTQRAVAEAVESRTIDSLLLDLSRADVSASTIEIYESTAASADLFPRDFRQAFIVPSDGGKKDDARFAENVAQNRGIPLRMFADEPSARAWLAEAER